MDGKTSSINIPERSSDNVSGVAVAAASGSRPRNSSFIASLLGRSLSLSDDHYLYTDNQTTSDSAMDVSISRSRSFSVGDESVDGIEEESSSASTTKKISGARGRAATTSLLGDHGISVDSNEVFISSCSNENATESFASVASHRETSQTDHINKKLLSSFLTRINTMATNFIDPTGTGQSAGQVYTDDVVMDHILKRVEKSSNSNLNK